MAEELAVEYSGKRNDRFIVGSMEKLEKMMNTVMDSNTMITLLQRLINESLRQELKDESVQQEIQEKTEEN